MDHLASCYFCGTALDDTLRDYRVVPVELRDTDDATTATLCQSCHGKLERLLAPVVEAAGEDGATLDARPAPERRGDGDVATAGATDSDGDGGGTGAGGDEDETPLGDVEANLVDVDEEPLAEDDEAGSADPLAGSGDDTDADESEGSEEEETVRVRHETSDDGGPGRSSESDTDEGETDTGDETEAEAEAGDNGGSETARTTVSALEYNKVMRLLQNREFPVDREGFERVAANAYELAEHECAEVIDLAIDRGLVAERDGQLVRPD